MTETHSENPETNPPEPADSLEDATEGNASAADAEVDELAESERRLAALKDQLLRTAADFDNYRKRSRREVEDATAAGRESLLKELLPVFDNLERATAHAEQSTDVAAFASGIEMVMRQFQDTLKKLGVERVISQGQPFDPSVHEAIQQLATNDVPPGHVAAEIQGGYRFGERLIRPALVVVASAKVEEN